MPESEASNALLKQNRLGRLLRLAVGFGVIGLLAVTIAAKFDGTFLLGDRCVHFTAYWAVLAAILMLFAIILKWWKTFILLSAILLIHVVPLVQLSLPAPAPTASADTPLTVLSANLYVNNERKTEAVEALLALDADVVVLMEVSREWAPFLKPLQDRYMHQLGVGSGDWLLSRYPLENPERIEVTAKSVMELTGQEASAGNYHWDGNAILKADIAVGAKSLRLVAIHPPIPAGRNGYLQQSAQIPAYQAALQSGAPGDQKLLIGDFNTTAFSTTFQRIVNATKLRNAAQGKGYRPTWGPRLPKEPLLPWVGIPIDHALVSDSVHVEGVELGETPGADHRWQLVRLKL